VTPASSAHPSLVSHRTVRRAVGLLALLLPLLLVPGGYFGFGFALQDNLSSYVHTPLRDVFVGTLCGIGVLFFCYRGHDRFENWTANLAGVFALGLGLFPLDADSDPLHQRTLVGFLHTACGGGFFLTLAWYSLFHFPRVYASDTDPEPHRPERNLLYRVSGGVIAVSMLAMAAYLLLLPDPWQQAADRWHALLWLEWLAVWSFAAAWLIKGRIIGADLVFGLVAAARTQLRGRP